MDEWKGDTLSYTVPAFIYSKSIEPTEVNKPMMTIDWAPTLANLFGLDSAGKYVGNDILAPENGGFAYFENYLTKVSASRLKADVIRNLSGSEVASLPLESFFKQLLTSSMHKSSFSFSTYASNSSAIVYSFL